MYLSTYEMPSEFISKSCWKNRWIFPWKIPIGIKYLLMAYLTFVDIEIEMRHLLFQWNIQSFLIWAENCLHSYFDITFTGVSMKYLKVLSLNNILNFILLEFIQTLSGPNETTTKGYILLEAWTRPSLKKEMHQNAMPFHAIGSS